MVRRCLGLTLLVFASLNALVAASPPADLGTFELDPVLLLDRGERTEGDPTITVNHRHFTYRFASERTRDGFLADPDRYAVAQGGACPRMGALSGVGRPELWGVHEGRLYFCASPGCRASFERMPGLLVETADEPPAGDEASLERGRELMDAAVAWAGGRDAWSRLAGFRIAQDREVESAGRTYKHRSETQIVLPDSCRVTTAWDDDVWVRRVDATGGSFDDRGEKLRVMDADQENEARRQMGLHVPVLLAAYARGEITPVAIENRKGQVRVHHLGKTSELTIDPATGEILAQRYRGWGGPDAVLGQCEKRFTAFRRVAGYAFPSSWEVSFEGRRTPGADVPQDWFSVAVFTQAPGES